MDLKVAAVKYAAGALLSAHLPVIAAQALEDGYCSHALGALASETDTAGYGSGWHLIRDNQGFHRLLADSSQRTAITLVLKSPLLDRGIAGDALRNAAIQSFRHFGDLGLAVVPQEDTLIEIICIEWTLARFRTADAIDDHQAAETRIGEFFEEVLGEDVLVARHPEWWNIDETMTAYVPDSDGVARFGAY